MDLPDFEAVLKSTGEVGFLKKLNQTLAEVDGLPGATLGELIIFESGEFGFVSAIHETCVEAMILSKNVVSISTRAARTGTKLKIPVGQCVLGRVVNVLGEVLTGPKVAGGCRLGEIDPLPKGIASRKKITKQLETGVAMVDLLVPIGKGQRELVLGDRKTGKSHLLMQIAMAQAKAGTCCVYAAVGKKQLEIAKAYEFFKTKGVADKCVVVAASSQDSPGEIFLSPYVAMAIAEGFRDEGRDVLLVIDDLSTHAKFYRELSLISRKFPGRDSYPGDIFHVHSKLLERAGNFAISTPKGEAEAAITCLPVAETVQGDITGYIATNLMSMTDGHIFFDSDLFFKGRRPAINPFVSVTRVGHQTQAIATKDAGRMVMELLNSYEKTQSFLKFGAELGEMSRQILSLGDKIIKFFDQPLFSVMKPSLSVVMMGMLIAGMWDGRNLDKLIAAIESKPELAQLVDSLANESENMNKLMEETRKVSSQILPFVS